MLNVLVLQTQLPSASRNGKYFLLLTSSTRYTPLKARLLVSRFCCASSPPVSMKPELMTGPRWLGSRFVRAKRRLTWSLVRWRARMSSWYGTPSNEDFVVAMTAPDVPGGAPPDGAAVAAVDASFLEPPLEHAAVSATASRVTAVRRRL